MAERSTAAVDVADASGGEPLTAKAEQATADGLVQSQERETAGGAAETAEGDGTRPEPSPSQVTEETGHDTATSPAGGTVEEPGGQDGETDGTEGLEQTAGADSTGSSTATTTGTGTGTDQGAKGRDEPRARSGDTASEDRALRDTAPEGPRDTGSGTAPKAAEGAAEDAEDAAADIPHSGRKASEGDDGDGAPQVSAAPASQDDAPANDTAGGTDASGAGGDTSDTADTADTSDSPLEATAQQTIGLKPPDATPPADASTKQLRRPADKPAPPELHSGHKLARRYRLEECVTRLDGFSSWRAVDEKLRRAVGVHLLPATHPRARSVLAAARSSALLGDPRFVQVLDAVEEDDLVYVVQEWLPDAVDLTALLASGPLEVHEAYQMVGQVSQAMAAAHREGLAHLRLDPGAVLRTSSGQWRIRGLAVNAALRGVTSKTPQRTDTEAIGALLYASLTQRWPYEDDAYGLSGLPKGVGLVAPDQVRAGVHRGLAELAMRALVNDGATASRQEPPCTTPEDLVKAIGQLPRIRPPEPAFTAAPAYQRTTYQQGSYGRGGPVNPATAVLPPTPPPPLQSRTGRALKWGVSALLIVALGLGSWQLAEALMQNGTSNEDTSQTTDGGKKGGRQEPRPLAIHGAAEYYPDGKPQHPGDVGLTYDNDPSTYWRTYSYHAGPTLAPYKKGVGIVYDLGSAQAVAGASIGLHYGGDHTTVSLYAADSLSPSTSLDGMKKIATGSTTGQKLSASAENPVTTRYVLLWLTAAPHSEGDQYSGAGYKQAITDVMFKD